MLYGTPYQLGQYSLVRKLTKPLYTTVKSVHGAFFTHMKGKKPPGVVLILPSATVKYLARRGVVAGDA